MQINLYDHSGKNNSYAHVEGMKDAEYSRYKANIKAVVSHQQVPVFDAKTYPKNFKEVMSTHLAKNLLQQNSQAQNR